MNTPSAVPRRILKIAQLRLELARLQGPQNSEINRINVAIQEQDVELAQIALDEINVTYEGLHITSPIDGTVLSVSILEGGTVRPIRRSLWSPSR